MLQIEIRLVTSEEAIIRKYKNTSYVQLCEVHDKARMQELITGNAVELYTPLERTIYKEELSSETIYVAEVSSHVVGLIAFRKNELGYIYMLKEYQGKSIGGKLLDTATPYLKRSAFLEAFPMNIRAKGLYSSREFVEETKEKAISK